jgi:hypothetical protein
MTSAVIVARLERLRRAGSNGLQRMKVDDIAGGAPIGEVPSRSLRLPKSRRATSQGIVDVVEQIQPNAQQVALLGDPALSFGGRLIHTARIAEGR